MSAKKKQPAKCAGGCGQNRPQGTTYCGECEAALTRFHAAYASLDRVPDRPYRAERVMTTGYTRERRGA